MLVWRTVKLCPRLVVANDVVVVQTGERLDLAQDALVVLAVGRVQLDAFNRVVPSVQLVLNLAGGAQPSTRDRRQRQAGRAVRMPLHPWPPPMIDVRTRMTCPNPP